MEQRVFDTNVQLVKYRVLKEVIRHAYNGTLRDAYLEIPKAISPGPKPELRCCIYKERAIIQDRIKMAMGGDADNPNPVQVIETACDECPAEGVMVTPACRGCMVHACKDVCPKGAISIVNHHAVVDKEKCIECGKCSKACPYSAIIMQHRPCMASCKVKAISIDENKKAKIDNNKCISCGQCVYKCPFGAITDRSFVLDIIDMLKKSENNTKYKVYAVVAPAIVSQCRFGRPTQVVTAIMKLGFHQVVEAAMGADVCLYNEAKEWAEKKLMTTSCCPSFVAFVEKNFPELVPYISHSLSPMNWAARMIKATDPTAKVLVEKDGIPVAVVHDFGKGKGVYLSKFEKNNANNRMLLNLMLYARGMDLDQKFLTSHPDAECAYYPASKKLVVINNSDKALTTTVKTNNGTKEFFLNPFETQIVDE